MGRKSIINPYLLFENADISSDYTSQEVNMRNLDSLGFSITWSGVAPDGLLYVDARISDNVWHQLEFDESIIINGNSGLHTIQLLAGAFEAVRLRYVSNSGAGNLTCYVTGKVIGD
jgi:hypothetical protein